MRVKQPKRDFERPRWLRYLMLGNYVNENEFSCGVGCRGRIALMRLVAVVTVFECGAGQSEAVNLTV